jgi:hypothetical protein
MAEQELSSCGGLPNWVCSSCLAHHYRVEADRVCLLLLPLIFLSLCVCANSPPIFTAWSFFTNKNVLCLASKVLVFAI